MLAVSTSAPAPAMAASAVPTTAAWLAPRPRRPDPSTRSSPHSGPTGRPSSASRDRVRHGGVGPSPPPVHRSHGSQRDDGQHEDARDSRPRRGRRRVEAQTRIGLGLARQPERHERRGCDGDDQRESGGAEGRWNGRGRHRPASFRAGHAERSQLGGLVRGAGHRPDDQEPSHDQTGEPGGHCQRQHGRGDEVEGDEHGLAGQLTGLLHPALGSDDLQDGVRHPGLGVGAGGLAEVDGQEAEPELCDRAFVGAPEGGRQAGEVGDRVVRGQLDGVASDADHLEVHDRTEVGAWPPLPSAACRTTRRTAPATRR